MADRAPCPCDRCADLKRVELLSRRAAALRPMLAKLTTVPPPDEDNWALEMKWDGVRALAFVERGQVRLM